MIAELPPNFLQSKKWAKMNEIIGHKVIKEKIGTHINYLIVKSARRGRYLEIPGGPVIDWSNKAEVSAAFTKIREIAKENKCVFIRLRPQLLKNDENLAILRAAGARIAPMHLHAEHTVIIDLTKSEEELLADMRRQTRYEVRRAAKLGIEVKSGNSEELFREFHSAQSITARRQHFIPPDLRTLLAEREAFKNNAMIYVAKAPILSDPGSSQQRERTIGSVPVTTGDTTGARVDKDGDFASVAYGLILCDGAEAEYFEAASTDLNRKLPGAYALQWQVIRDLKKQGIKRYNLWGIAPPGAKNHRYSGVTTFKTGFGGEIIEFVPAHDIVISPARYKLDLAIEKVRKKRRNL
ncbi:peptidoglycan bridge formation glycyltransferase FemA/FemB family protein [Candidatus Saccharibacteria bacterium]|nr:peptidoglycan bridge formation glycyltransferase FemA/FemB family protein [Candidatus Saccharibacteria bacterium]